MALRPSLALALANPSQVVVWKDFVHSIAVEMGVHEQLLDLYKAQIETLVDRAPVHNIAWVIARAFEFQYDATTPQFLQLVDGVPTYVPVNTALRIITRCFIRFSTSRILNIYVTKSEPPAKLSALELSAIQDYYTNGGSSTDLGIGVGDAGIAHVLTSLDPDYVWIDATVYFNGQYSATIQTDVIAAIEAYLYSLGTKGELHTVKLIDAIQSVQGVNDINIRGLAIRPNATVFGSRTYLIQASAILAISQEAAAGYAYQEITGGETFTDKITFTVG